MKNKITHFKTHQMERPTIFKEPINKKTSSRNKQTIQYERGSLSTENRVFIENTANDAKLMKMPDGYDGGIIKKEFIDFEKEFPGLTFKPTDFLYDRMMNDAHNVFPRNRDLKNKVSTYFEEMIRRNLNNIYHYAPKFFTENFVQRTSVNNVAFEAYQVYIYLLCFISWTDKHRLDTDVRDFDNIDKILNWIATRRDPSIDFILSGPSSNSNMVNNDFRSHYRTLIDASNDMSSIIAYNQLSSTQTISSDVYNLINIIQHMPNVFFKAPDEARKYNINIDSAQDVLVKIDNDNNLIFDCSYVNLGDVTEQNKLAKFENLESVITNNKVNSMINTKKLAELFHNYSRIKILELIMTPDTYISSLDAFNKVFVVFKGVSCSERNVYNTIPTNFLKIGGKFVRTNRGYEFKMDVDAITYKSVLADVKSFEIYLTLDPNYTNQIIPNEYALSFNKHSIYQHPITTDVTYDSKMRGVRKVLTVREVSSTNQTNDNNEDGLTRETLDYSEALGFTDEPTKAQSLIINGKYSTSNKPGNYIPKREGSTDTTHERKMSFVDKLYAKLKISNPFDKTSIIHSLDEALNITQTLISNTANKYFTHFLTRTNEILSKIRLSWSLDDELNEMLLALSMSANIDNQHESSLFKAVNDIDSYERLIHTDEMNTLIDSYSQWSDVETLYDGTIYDANTIDGVILHDSTLSVSQFASLHSKAWRGALTNDDKALLHSSAWYVMTTYGNKSTLKTKIENKSQLTNDNKNELTNMVNNYTSLTVDCLLIVLQCLKSEHEAIISTLLFKHQPITTENKLLIIDLLTSFASNPISAETKLSIIDNITNITELSNDERATLETIIKRSLIIDTATTNNLLLITSSPESLKTQQTLIIDIIQADISTVSDIAPYISQINNYNNPLTPTLAQQLTMEINDFTSQEELIDAIHNASITPAQRTQLIDIYRRYLIKQPHELPFSVIDFINVINMFQLATTFNLSSPLDYTLSPDTNVVELKNFFSTITHDISAAVSSDVEFITATTTFINNYQLIGSDYYRYFKNIFESMINFDSTETLNDVYQFFTNFRVIYYRLFALLDRNVYINSATTDDKYSYRNVEVNTNNGTIDGKYFRINDINGFAEFIDPTTGENYTTPDPKFLIYNAEQNDLTLFNLYNKYNEIIDPIKYGSFIYSESLKTLQNINNEHLDYLNYQNSIRFDNNYLPNNEAVRYYTYYDKTNSIVFSDIINSISVDIGDFDSHQHYQMNNKDDFKNINTIKVSVLMDISSDETQLDTDYFNASCSLMRYDKQTRMKDNGEPYDVWIESSNAILIENATFIKITNDIVKDYNNQEGSTTEALYYVIGVVDSCLPTGSGESTTWNENLIGELVSFKARLISGIDKTEIIPIMIDENENNLRINMWRVEDLIIEPSMTTTPDNMTLTDSINNKTIISPNYEIQFINGLGFSTLQELMDNATTTTGDVYTISQQLERSTDSYTIDYVYDHSKSLLYISTTIEKEGTNDKYIETIYIMLNNKVVYKEVLNTTQQRIEEDEEVKVITEATNCENDLLRLNNDGLTVFDYYHFGLLEKYDTLNDGYSNQFKAFLIDGIDIKRTYWNKTAFINSLMLCPLQSCIPKDAEHEALYDSLEPEYSDVKGEVDVNGRLDNVIIYDYTNGFTRYMDRFVINSDGITRYDDNGNAIVGTIDYINITSNRKISCYNEYQQVLAEKGTVKTFYLTDSQHPNFFSIDLTVNEDVISNVVLYGARNVFDPNGESSSTGWIKLGLAPYVITSEQPNYLSNNDNLAVKGLTFEVIINYESNFLEFPGTKQITLNSISVVYVDYNTKSYIVDANDKKVKVADIQTVKYSNVPASFYDESDVLFRVLGNADGIYKLHPIFKYYEKGIVSPRYVDDDGDYIMLAEKYNQNVMAKPVYLRSQYNLNNPTVNTIKDSSDIVYRIGDRLDANKKHLLESVNKKMLMFGNVENDGTIESVAIKAQQIHAIPTASKMLLSVEFS